LGIQKIGDGERIRKIYEIFMKIEKELKGTNTTASRLFIYAGNRTERAKNLGVTWNH